MDITVDMLRAAGGRGSKLADVAAALTKHGAKWGLTTKLRVAAFLGQTGHESMGFTIFREKWGPTDAQKRYEGRKDLGNTQPGDGKFFLGRGLIQITGRHNVTKLARFLEMSITDTIAYLETVEGAVVGSLWWWMTNGCNDLADKASTEAGYIALTKRINGGTNGLVDRQNRFAGIRTFLGV